MRHPVPAQFGDDKSLVAGLTSGREDALAEAYRRHADAVYTVAYRLLGSTTEAEDVRQDVFVGLPEAARSYQGRGSFEGWLKRVAARLALMRHRQPRRRREHSSGWSSMRDPRGRQPDGQFRGADQDVVDRVALERALGELPVNLRAAFVLKEIEGFSHAQVGDVLGISVDASKVRLHRAKKVLRQLLAPNPDPSAS